MGFRRLASAQPPPYESAGINKSVLMFYSLKNVSDKRNSVFECNSVSKNIPLNVCLLLFTAYKPSF